MERESSRRSRTRTGCLKCRQRKIRCDESKPACQRCLKINVECPGYEERTRLFGLRVDECFDSEFEKTCFASFMSRGVQELASFRPSSREFWKTIVPQLADIHQTVRHATIALAVLQESAVRSDIDEGEDVRAIAYFHFNKAIRGFVDSGVTFGTIHKLTCCLLFNELMKTLEMMPAGAEHVKAARSILREHELAVNNRDAEFEPAIASIFAPTILRCTMDALTFLDEFEIEEDVFELAQDHLLQTPSTLSSVGEAVEIMDVFLKYAIVFHRGESKLSNQKLKDALDHFSLLLETTSDLDLQSLTLHLKMAYYLVRSRELDLQLFREIIQHSESMSIDRRGPTLGDIPPLFFTAMQCRDTVLRDHAIRILHNLMISERGFTSCMARRLAATKHVSDTEVSGELPRSTTVTTLDVSAHMEDERKVGRPNHVQRRVIEAYGYSGILCFVPKTDCDCMT